MQAFAELHGWQKSHRWVLDVYGLAAGLPSDERFGLVAQLKRAVVSVPANIAEGSRRRSNRDYYRFLDIAQGSLAEAQYLILLCADLGYLESRSARALRLQSEEIARMLQALQNRVRTPRARDGTLERHN